MIEMEIVGVQEVLPSSVPVVLLREADGERLLPIFIGMPEATAIGLALAGQDPPRPMTHDLMATLLATFSATLERVVVTELRDRTFFAEMYLRGPAGVEVVSARPSDAIALALRAWGFHGKLGALAMRLLCAICAWTTKLTARHSEARYKNRWA